MTNGYTKTEWAAYMRNWRKKNKDKVKKMNQKQRKNRRQYKKKYYNKHKKECNNAAVRAARKRNTGITPEYYDNKYEEQQGQCAICGTHQSILTKALSGDHSHITGKPRGLLCGVCNSQLGYYEIFLTNKDLVGRFNQYLKVYK